MVYIKNQWSYEMPHWFHLLTCMTSAKHNELKPVSIASRWPAAWLCLSSSRAMYAFLASPSFKYRTYTTSRSRMLQSVEESAITEMKRLCLISSNRGARRSSWMYGMKLIHNRPTLHLNFVATQYNRLKQKLLSTHLLKLHFKSASS